MNFYNHHIWSIFKSYSISVTFKFCAVRIALCALEPCSTDSLGTQHCANFESHSNRVTFETNAIRMTSSIQAQRYYPKAVLFQIMYMNTQPRISTSCGPPNVVTLSHLTSFPLFYIHSFTLPTNKIVICFCKNLLALWFQSSKIVQILLFDLEMLLLVFLYTILLLLLQVWHYSSNK